MWLAKALTLAGKYIYDTLKTMRSQNKGDATEFSIKNLAALSNIGYDYLLVVLHEGSGKNISILYMVKLAIVLGLSYDDALALINRFGSDIRFDWAPENEIYRRAIRAANNENIAAAEEVLSELEPYLTRKNIPENYLLLDRFIGSKFAP